MSINNLVFTGNCGGDMEVRYTKAGKAVGSVNVAMTQGWGESKKTTWVKCTVWGDRADSLAPYLKKGTPVTMQGELEIDVWQNKEGVDQTSIGCRVNSVAFSQAKSGNEAPQSTAAKQASSPQSSGQQPFDDDIPFS